LSLCPELLIHGIHNCALLVPEIHTISFVWKSPKCTVKQKKVIFLKITFCLIQSSRVGPKNVEQCHWAVNFDFYFFKIVINVDEFSTGHGDWRNFYTYVVNLFAYRVDFVLTLYKMQTVGVSFWKSVIKDFLMYPVHRRLYKEETRLMG
jgi:hypothetical protein